MTQLKLTREALLNDEFRRWAKQYRGLIRVTTPAERRASVRSTLERAPSPDQIWVFAYGSLLWNPAFRFTERRIGRVYGYHREFCLRTEIGRGSPEMPGLILGLEAGGSCRSVAYRIAEEEVNTELDLIWRREMLSSVYRPTWVTVHDGEDRLPAVTFVIDTRDERYVGDLDRAQMVQAIALASGSLGRCCDYLFETVDHLRALGIRDRRLEALADAVRARQEKIRLRPD